MGATQNLPSVHVKDGKVFANSREVAECFDKRHDNVLADIRVILNSGAVTRPAPDLLKSQGIDLWFIPVKYLDGRGREQISYDMTRDGLALLVMGYTGPKAMQFKVAYIQQFNEMEEALRNATPALPQTFAVSWGCSIPLLPFGLSVPMNGLRRT